MYKCVSLYNLYCQGFSYEVARFTLDITFRRYVDHECAHLKIFA